MGLIYTIITHGVLGEIKYYPSTGNPYNFRQIIILTPLFSFIMGCIMGSIEVLYISRLFVNKSFFLSIIIKTLIYFVSLILFLITVTMINNSLLMERGLFHPDVINELRLFIDNFAFWSIVIYAGASILISLFYHELSNYIGHGVLLNFFLGKYHRPKQEERIFMFLDIKSSTAIAEKLGASTYFRLLNDYYNDLSDAIIQNNGEVYQYVGDEIVVTWEMQKGLENNQCIQCFFDIKKSIKNNEHKYLETYGLVPRFKAGFHCGEVTTGRIGVLKQELIFTGDVLNAASRIQEECNQFNVDILISSELKERLSTIPGKSFDEIGVYNLRGRNAKVKLFTLTDFIKPT